MQGYLEKSSTGKLKKKKVGSSYVVKPTLSLGNVMASWDKRWFVLDDRAPPRLSYYRDLNDVERGAPAGVLYLDGSRVEWLDGKKLLAVFTETRVLAMRAVSTSTSVGQLYGGAPLELRQWMDAFVQAGCQHLESQRGNDAAANDRKTQSEPTPTATMLSSNERHTNATQTATMLSSNDVDDDARVPRTGCCRSCLRLLYLLPASCWDRCRKRARRAHAVYDEYVGAGRSQTGRDPALI